MPVINGSMMRSSASLPRRRRKNPPRDSSPRLLRRGISSSAPRRSLPFQDSTPLLRNGPSRVGTPSANPSGSSSRRPFTYTYVLRRSWFVPITRSARPSRRHSSMAHGFCDRKESGPPSMTKPPTRSVRILPPRRGAASTSVHWGGLSRGAALSVRPYAALRPAIPPPTISTVRESVGITDGRWSEAGFAEVGRHDIQQRLDERRGRVEHGDPFQPHALLARPLLELDVDVVEDFKVVRHEADGGHQDMPEPEAMQLIQRGFDCRAQPRFFRPSLTLIGKPPGRA